MRPPLSRPHHSGKMGGMKAQFTIRHLLFAMLCTGLLCVFVASPKLIAVAIPVAALVWLSVADGNGLLIRLLFVIALVALFWGIGIASLPHVRT